VSPRASAGLGLLALCAVLVGCGRPAPPKAETIQFWALGREGEAVEPLVREFERQHPGIRVRLQQIPFSAAHEKLLTAYMGDAVPDVAQLGNTWVAELTVLDALERLDSHVASSSSVDSADYFPGIWQTNLIHDGLYGIPWYVDTRVIFYRTDLLARAGFPAMPATWPDWVAAMRSLKQLAGGHRYPIFLPTNEWAQPVIFGMQAGSPILKDGDRYGAFADSAFRRGFEFYVGLFRDGFAPPLGANDIGNVYQEFARGTFAMWITGPWNIGQMRAQLPPEVQEQWGTAPLPGPDGDSSRVSFAGGSSLVLFRRSRHAAAAWQLIEFLSRPDQQVRFYELTGDLPARRSAWTRSGLATDRYARAFWEQLQRVRPLPKVPEWELIATRVLEYAELSIRGRTPPDAALGRLDREVDRSLAKRRWVLGRVP
jgi:multiple sugar transport system substrate-binding protein